MSSEREQCRSIDPHSSTGRRCVLRHEHAAHRAPKEPYEGSDIWWYTDELALPSPDDLGIAINRFAPERET